MKTEKELLLEYIDQNNLLDGIDKKNYLDVYLAVSKTLAFAAYKLKHRVEEFKNSYTAAFRKNK